MKQTGKMTLEYLSISLGPTPNNLLGFGFDFLEEKNLRSDPVAVVGPGRRAVVVVTVVVVVGTRGPETGPPVTFARPDDGFIDC